jgi:hypothetical protein
MDLEFRPSVSRSRSRFKRRARIFPTHSVSFFSLCVGSPTVKEGLTIGLLTRSFLSKGGSEMKIPNEVLKAVDALPQERRERVEAIVRRHLEACYRMGIEPEYMDRVWIEAMESVEIEEKFPETVENEPWPEYEPIRSYDVYRSPRADW